MKIFKLDLNINLWILQSCSRVKLLLLLILATVFSLVIRMWSV